MNPRLQRFAACCLLAAVAAAIAAADPSAADSAGAAASIAKAGNQEKVDIIREGLFHWPMIPLWVTSVVLCALVFERWRALRPQLITDEAMISTVVDRMGQGDVVGAQQAAAASDTVIGRAWGQALHEYQLGGVRLDDVLHDSTLLAVKPLKRNLNAIATIGTISPLFGLFATVIGIIISFGQMGAAGGADKAELAKAIGVALFGTAGGILLAIPAVILSRFFSARVNGIAEYAEAEIDRLKYAYARCQAEGRAPAAASAVARSAPSPKAAAAAAG